MKFTVPALLTPLAVLALSACGSSPPTRFFVLSVVPPAHRSAAAASVPIKLSAVHLPDLLDRLQIVAAAGPNQIKLRSEDQWAAPLDDMTRRVLGQDLEERLPAGSVVFPRSPAPKGTRDLVVELQAFGLDASGQARLDGDWALVGPDRKPVVSREVRLSEPAAGAAAASQAAAMSRLLGRLADQIAETAD